MIDESGASVGSSLTWGFHNFYGVVTVRSSIFTLAYHH